MTKLPGVLLAFLGFAACHDAGPPGLEGGAAYGVGLTALHSCPDLEAAARERAIARMTAELSAAQVQALKHAGETCYQDAYASDGAEGGVGGGASHYSTTNTQVAGVDEPDFVKNDGKYIYTATENTFRIIEAYPAASMHEVARVTLDGNARKLFVVDDLAVLYVAVPPTASTAPASPECTYGYHCAPTGDGTATHILVFDIHDRRAPKLQRELALSGSLIAARRVGTAVHTVLSNAALAGPYVSVWPEGIWCEASPLQIITAFSQLYEKNVETLRSASFTAVYPQGTDSAHPGINLYGSCENAWVTQTADDAGLTSLVSFDLVDTTPPAVNTVVSTPGFVYASDSALYMAVSHDRANFGWFDEAPGLSQASTVYAFGLGRQPTFLGSGLVPGHVISQFAMDAWQDHLRVATSIGWVPAPDVDSSVTVLALQGNALVRVGGVDHIAPQEDIRAVRFDGNRGYLCTFKKTDPIFVLALDAPQAPKVLGELHIPGFSTYMHMLDDTHLLTIGYNAEDMGSFAFFSGILLQIIDVTDPANPTRQFVTEIGTRGSSSAALTNHLAFNYFAPKGVLAIPMTVCEGGSGGGNFGTEMTFNGLQVYDVSLQTGITLRGGISTPADGSACGNWWTDATSTVKRSVIMDDSVYAVTGGEIRVQDLGALGTDVARVRIAGP